MIVRQHLDTGERCEEHVGEVFPPRCYDCAAAAIVVYAPLDARRECTLHPGYPGPCARCERDAE